jgi:hypothetical protein
MVTRFKRLDEAPACVRVAPDLDELGLLETLLEQVRGIGHGRPGAHPQDVLRSEFEHALPALLASRANATSRE